MSNDELVARIERVKAHLDRAWEQTDELLADLYDEDGGPHDEVYAVLSYAYEEYLVRASRIVDDSVWKARRLGKEGKA